jgi:hypothetical protein
MATVQSAGLMFSRALFSGFTLILRQGKAAAVPSLAEEILAGGRDALASFDPRTWWIFFPLSAILRFYSLDFLDGRDGRWSSFSGERAAQGGQDCSQFMKFLLLGIVALFATTGCTVVTENGSETVFPLLGSDDDLYMKAENPVVLPWRCKFVPSPDSHSRRFWSGGSGGDL